MLLMSLAWLTINSQNSFKIGRSPFYALSKSIHKIKDWPCFTSVLPLCWATGSKDIRPAQSSASVQGVPQPPMGWGWRAPLGIAWSNPLSKAGSPAAGCSGPCPIGFWKVWLRHLYSLSSGGYIDWWDPPEPSLLPAKVLQWFRQRSEQDLPVNA